MAHSSSVTEWLTLFLRNNHPQTNDTCLTKKWIFIYLPPGNGQAQSQRPPVEDESAILSGWGPYFPMSQPPAGTPIPTSHLAPPDEPHAKLEHQGALWSTILPKYSHL